MNIDLTYIYSVINSVKAAMIDGERVEIIVTPKEENDKYVHNNERTITIGLQGGLSRDRRSFHISNGNEFDSKILPLLLNYFSNEDNFANDWNITEPVFSENTYKARLETESGNLLYIETFDGSLFENLRNYQLEIPPEKNKFNVNQLFWESLVNCAKNRITTRDIFSSEKFTQTEKQALEQFLEFFGKSKLLVNSRGNVANKRAPLLIKKLFDSNGYTGDIIKMVTPQEYEWFTKNISKELIKKIDTDLLNSLGNSLRGETKFNQFLDKHSNDIVLSHEEIMDRKRFAVGELHRESVNYFGFGKKLTKIEKLQSIYNTVPGPENLEPEQVRKYNDYCDELRGYVEANTARRKRTEAKQVTPNDVQVQFTPVSSSEFNNDFDFLIDSIRMCKEGRVNDEKFELIIETDPKNKSKRLVRVTLLNGISRRDNFNFSFDSSDFDAKIPGLLDLVRENDAFAKVSSVPGDIETTYIQTNDSNEVLIKLPSGVVDLGLERRVDPMAEPKTGLIKTIENSLNPATAFSKGSDDYQMFNELLETIEMVKQSKVDGERYEIIVDRGLKDTSKREVRISLVGGIARDSYSFDFNDGVAFDSMLPQIFDRVCLDDKISTVKTTETGLIERTNDSISLFTTESANEVLVRYNLPNDLPIANYLKPNNVECGLSKSDREVIEYFRLNLLSEVKKLTDIERKRLIDLIHGNDVIRNIAGLIVRLKVGRIKENDFVQQVEHLAKHIPKGVILGIVERLPEKKKYTVSPKDVVADNLHQQIKNYFVEPSKTVISTFVEENKYFEELHELVRRYKIYTNANGDLEVFFRDSNERYTASDVEKSKIQFAHFWASMAGVKSSSGDLIPGEVQAFGDDSRNLFNIMSVQFIESIKKGISVDFDSLKKEFDNSSYSLANNVFNRLFKNEEYIEFIKSYYQLQLKQEKDLTVPFREQLDSTMTTVTSEQTKDELRRELTGVFGEILEKRKIADAARKVDILDAARVVPREEEKRARAINILEEIKNEPSKSVLPTYSNSNTGSGVQDEIRTAVRETLEKSENKSRLSEEVIKSYDVQDVVKSASVDEEKRNEVITAYEQVREEQQAESLIVVPHDYKTILDEQTIRAEVRRAIDEAVNKNKVDNSATLEVVEDKDEVIQEVSVEESVISEIRDAYEIADEHSTLDSPASLKIFFSKENPDMGQIIVSHGPTNDETVILDKTVSREVLMGELLSEICRVYVENSGSLTTETFEVPNTNKAGLIALGRNDNLLQISNATKEEVVLVQENINFAKENSEVAEHNNLRTM
ncbi:MAG: hypothetical protein J6C46_11965 [Clostridia bacterium]|nr:hypothetical protein [Clostridia bacterium]